ncbi:MAG: DUF4870 domain-containing protein [Wenzhouxiangella sp.]|nr:MAG: DUF4870 domain-containing protein [Wenzhouxiangella sp.]
MSNKAIGIVAYITIIGWIIAFVVHKTKDDKSALAGYHIEQSLGLILVAVGLAIIGQILGAVAAIFGLLLMVVNIGLIVLWVFGLMNAINEKREPIPLIGPFFEGKFGFINA